MKILVVGSGGREHALTWALARSRHKPQMFAAPGNPGTAQLATNVSIAADDIAGLVDYAGAEGIDLCVVGPEAPLVLGLADRLMEAGIRVMGPSAAAARLEGSKAFAKAFMERHGIPTAAHRTFAAEEVAAAREYVRSQGAPIVVKASGLAAGKGAIVCETIREALSALEMMMEDRAFGSAGSEVVIESFMMGEEASIFALCDGTDYVLFPSAQDHKRIGEGDTGPNTGGMGAYCPAPVVSDAVLEQTRRDIIEPTIAGMLAEGTPYRGILYVGLMIGPDGPRVVEYNCRFGDPETQPMMLLLESDLVDAFMAAAEGVLSGTEMRSSAGAAACIVLASHGYPGAYSKGCRIEGTGEAGRVPGVQVFHSGTSGSDHLVSAGGRVLGIAAVGADLTEAVDRAYEGVALTSFPGMQYRQDIGQKGLSRLVDS
jgi:phosphoribosylamine---glycine ligase